jgi:hypothetical protein
MTKRGAIAIAAALWLLEWVTGWSAHLGDTLGSVIGLVWLVMFGYFVVVSRQGKIPRALHTWGWMTAVLVVSVARAWWIGVSAERSHVFAELAAHFPGIPPIDPQERKVEIAIVDALFSVVAVGFVVGLVGAFEASIIGVTSWFADRFRADREPPRVGLVSRLAIMVLQAPIFVGVMAIGLAAVGGATDLATHATRPDTPETVRALAPGIAGFGVAVWALATFHLGRLYALARGGLVNRVVLAAFGIAAVVALVAFGARSVSAVVTLVVWLGLQLVAIRFARPRGGN